MLLRVLSKMCYSEILTTAIKFIVLMCVLVRLGTAYGKHLLTLLYSFYS